MLPRKWKRSTGWSGRSPMRIAFSTLMYWPKAPPMKICFTSREVDADAVAEHLEAGVDGRLGADQAVDVGLGEGDVAHRAALARPGDDVLRHAVAHAHPSGGRLAVEASGLVEQPRDEQLAEQVDEAAAADAHGRGVVDGAERRFDVSSAMNTSSMAPSVARMPWATPPPSKAGPAEQAQEISQSLLPRTISPLVPMSMNRVSLSVANIPEESTPAVMSPPT